MFPQLADPVMLPKMNSGKGNIQNLTPYERLLESKLWYWEGREGREGEGPLERGKGGAAHFSW